MRNFLYNPPAVIALLSALFFSYLSFMGMLYLFDGDLLKALEFALIGLALMIVCVYYITRFKMSKFKEKKRIGLIVFGTIMFVVYLGLAIPFASFFNAWQHRNEIDKCLKEIKVSAINMDKAYASYVDERVDSLGEKLNDDTLYLHNFGKNEILSPVEKRMLLMSSLRRQLMPSSLYPVQNERKRWVESLQGMSIWNIMLPANLSGMNESVGKWVTDYRNLSDINYTNSNFKLFEYTDFSLSMKQLVNDLEKVHLSFWAVIIALFCLLLMLLPYLLADSLPIQEENQEENDNDGWVL